MSNSNNSRHSSSKTMRSEELEQDIPGIATTMTH